MKKLLLLSAVLICLGCGNHHPETESTSAEDTPINTTEELQAIEVLRANFSLALKEGRYEDMSQYVTSNVKTVRAGGSGYDDMFALGASRGRFPYDSIRMQPTETIIVNDSTAYDWGSSTVYYTDDNGAVVALRNAFLAILKKEDGQWKLHREVGSSAVE